LNWNSIARSFSAFAVYMAIMIAYFASSSPIAFALCLAAILCAGVLTHSKYFTKTTEIGFDQSARLVLPSLSESMDELHCLQNEINELQTQFAVESSVQQNARNGFPG